MQSTLNKYLPNDITNIILEFHYKSMFSEVLKELKKSIFIYNRILDHIHEDELTLTFFMCAMSHVRFSNMVDDESESDDSDEDTYQR